jgi:phosphoadenosine phosphosulfate reductase
MRTELLQAIQRLWPESTLPSIAHLNALFQPLGFRERIHLLYAYVQPTSVLATSSFGIHSGLFLYTLTQLQPEQTIVSVDTGYLFAATEAYREMWMHTWGLQVEVVYPDSKEHASTQTDQTWTTQPDQCCAINKVAPLEQVKANKTVWMSGLMAWQTPFRRELSVFEEHDGIVKFHPMLDLDRETFEALRVHLAIPPHPLEAEGYGSVGCTHCTQKGAGRAGRWKGQSKTECGLHWPIATKDPSDNNRG